MHNVCWFGCCRSKNMQEICRLRSALEAANAIIATAELCARNQTASITAAEARIAELERNWETAETYLMKAIVRAERAEARVAELEKEVAQWRASIGGIRSELSFEKRHVIRCKERIAELEAKHE